jgi:hypothetical protein
VTLSSTSVPVPPIGDRASTGLRWVAPVTAWGLVAVSEISTHAVGGLPLLTFPFQVVAWVLAVWITLRRLRRTRLGGVLPRAVAAVLILAAAVWFSSWSTFAPAAYLRLHQSQFDYAAAHPPSDAYLGSRLPLAVRLISVNWNTSQLGDGMIFVPQYVGINDAGGFVHAPPGVPQERVFDLYGWGGTLGSCKHLSGNWYYC